ncbi:MAG: glycosyltransferase [Lamprocystis purpurea]|uniref:glycosyltransferase n=1 Tax=Lamprocystis purpurea TaxID=61598 RepID=UPI00036E7F9A|nr:glycosyltransferase [Lamprocystis purpurea]MBV5274153.1 glycosyltransferase [Lamprocystis purpurea]
MNDIDIAAVAAITVTYNPDLGPLRAQLAALPAESLKILVDNASQPDTLEQIEILAKRTPNTRLLRNTQNLGLAAAVNRGVCAARAHDPRLRLVLLLDQDSEPLPNSIQILVEALDTLERQGEPVGGVGPCLLDVDTGLSHGFHQAARWRWKRTYPPPGSPQPVTCTTLNGSGTLVQIDLFLQLGGLDEALFIDHVDTEWSFRVLAAGFRLWGVPAAVFNHRMGQSSIRFWLFGWRVWPSRSPQRHFFLFRNALLLMRRPYIPRVWKVWALAKLMLTAVVHGLFDDQRREQWKQMRQGLSAGLRIASTPLSHQRP